jgi:hypothetical protein
VSRQVTHADYRDVLIPRAEAIMAKGPISILYVIGEDFTGYEALARLHLESGR